MHTDLPQECGADPDKPAETLWQQVHVEAQSVLALPAEQSDTLLAVTVVNKSTRPLHPDNGDGIFFSFRLIGLDGHVISCECVRTALNACVPAGASHTQDIGVLIPQQYLKRAAALRVGLIQNGEFWVERINPAHPAVVRLDFGASMSHAQRVVWEGSEIWPQGRSNGLVWPAGAMMVSEKHKILYVPVAKCACTSLKSLMVELAEIEQHEKAIQLGVHFVTDRFNTGAQLKDKTMKRAWQILASDQYFKFIVIREPFERLVSAYLEKFVYNRHDKRNLLHTRAVLRQVQNTDQPDLQRGISFDEFVACITRQDPMKLDPHWRPQHLYLAKVRHMTNIYRLENIAQLEVDLQQKLGITTPLKHSNKTRKSELPVAEVSTMTADTIDSLAAFDPDSFLSSKHSKVIRDYYARDFELYCEATSDTPAPP